MRRPPSTLRPSLPRQARSPTLTATQAARRRLLVWSAASAAATLGRAWANEAPGVDVLSLRVQRSDSGGVFLDFSPRIVLSRTVQEALERGVPVYFVAQATLLRYRWYWRDERIARAQRSWRLAFQPLTSTWRVGAGGLSQTFPSLQEALAAIRLTAWRVADPSQTEADQRYRVEFAFQLDTSQLPGPMQIGLTTQTDWVLGVERLAPVE
jgi:hypothetical protein